MTLKYSDLGLRELPSCHSNPSWPKPGWHPSLEAPHSSQPQPLLQSHTSSSSASHHSVSVSSGLILGHFFSNCYLSTQTPPSGSPQGTTSPVGGHWARSGDTFLRLGKCYRHWYDENRDTAQHLMMHKTAHSKDSGSTKWVQDRALFQSWFRQSAMLPKPVLRTQDGNVCWEDVLHKHSVHQHLFIEIHK
jgi:hypothetical protein